MVVPPKIQRLITEMSHIRLDLKDGEQWNVAPGREEVAGRLLQVGLTNASLEDLDYVVFKAMSTMGSVDTLKAVLPWFLAAAVREPGSPRVVDLDTLTCKLDYADFSSWPASQRRATLDALEEFRRAVAGLDPEDDTLDAFDTWAARQETGKS